MREFNPNSHFMILRTIYQLYINKTLPFTIIIRIGNTPYLK